MEDLLTLLAAGSLISAAAFITRNLVSEKLLRFINKEVSIVDKEGKKTKFIVKFNTPDEDIYKLLDRELEFEGKVKNSLTNYINKHKEIDMNLSEENTFDFLISFDNTKIAFEAKSSIESLKTKWIEDYFIENNEISELIMVLETEVPDNIMKEIRRSELGDKVKFISSLQGRDLSQSIENILNSEIPKLQLNKTLQRTNH
ncbi:hypothetical protein Q9252_00045 [Marinobacter salarius]|uniref:hypothetical protein n=1 Tax=Marinobacter salarius TaxID=1420917 RepID=UPI00273AF3A6|nr:hypothetical protein [Marinobacter salarius]MDP4530506.1 hypothetical protein [Marinobacter salarius]